MGRSVFLLSALILLVSTLKGQSGVISEAEYVFVKNYLETTRDGIIQTLDSITDETFIYKPMDGGWSVKECMEHVLLAEKGIFSEFKDVLDQSPGEISTRYLDAWLISKVSDRGTKVVTPLPMVDSHKSRAQLMDQLRNSRNEILAFISAFDQIEFRNHFGKSPYGPADAYQLLLVAAAHSMRHHHQMLEVIGEFGRLDRN